MSTFTMNAGQLEAVIGPVARSWAQDKAIATDHTTEDLVQIGILAVLEKAGKFDPARATPEAFTAMVARSTFGKVRRALKRRPGHTTRDRIGNDPESGERDLPVRGMGPLRESELAEGREIVGEFEAFLRSRGREHEARAVRRVLDGQETKPDYRVIRETGARYPVRRDRIGRAI